MAAHGKLAWFLIVMCAAILVESQMFRQFTRGGGIRRGFGRFPTFSSSPRLVRLGQPIRPTFRRRQQQQQQQQQRRQQPRRTTVLQQTFVVNDRTNTPNSRQSQRSPRRNRLGAGGARHSSGARRIGSRGIPRSSFRRVPSIFSLGQRSPRGRSAARRPTINSRNLVRMPNPSSIQRAQPVFLIPSGNGRGAGARVGGSHSGGNHQIGNLGLSMHPGIGLRTGTSAGRRSGLNVGGGAGHGTGSVGGIAADLGLNPGTATNLLAAGMGMDLAEINALTTLLGQSNQQTNAVNSLLGQTNQLSMQQSALPAVPAVTINAPAVSINASPTGPSPTASSVNPQVILGQILGDNRREGAPGALQGDANERLIERIRAIDPNLLPPDV